MLNESMTAKDVSVKLKCSIFYVYKHFKELGGFKIGGLVRFDPDELERRLKEAKDGSMETSR